MLKLNDRVSRQIEIGRPERKFGIIIEIYKSKQGFVYTPMRLFAVRWDNIGNEERGYFEEGLQKET